MAFLRSSVHILVHNEMSENKKAATFIRNCLVIKVPGGGIEPPLTCVNQILSLARLPIPPSGHILNWWDAKVNNSSCIKQYSFIVILLFLQP